MTSGTATYVHLVEVILLASSALIFQIGRKEQFKSEIKHTFIPTCQRFLSVLVMVDMVIVSLQIGAQRDFVTELVVWPEINEVRWKSARLIFG